MEDVIAVVLTCHVETTGVLSSGKDEAGLGDSADCYECDDGEYAGQGNPATPKTKGRTPKGARFSHGRLQTLNCLKEDCLFGQAWRRLVLIQDSIFRHIGSGFD